MRAITYLCLFSSLVLWATPLMAAEAPWQSPSTVRISPQGARLTVSIKTPLNAESGQPQASFFLPAAAQDVSIRYGSTAPLEWSSTIVPVDTLTGDVASQRTYVLGEIAKVQGRISALQARITLWATPPTTALTQEQMQSRQTALDTVLPTAQQELAVQQRALQEWEKQLANLPDTAQQAQKITAVFPVATGQAEDVLHYSYTLGNCGWQPTYVFNALPDKSLVEATLIAKIWQFSGINWHNAAITLVPQGDAQREPTPLRPWRIHTGDVAPEPRDVRPRAALMALPMDSNAETAPLNQLHSPRMQDSTASTMWNMGQRFLPEGTMQVTLNSDTWKSPLLWLARPATSTQVWLQAKHELTNVRQWPVGEAAFFLDGLSVGNGMFAPKGDSVTVYFGVDPRVTVLNATDPRLSGKEGFIDKRKTWSWQWEFTVHNGRPAPVDVRIEESAPQLSDKSLTITYTTQPAPQQGPDHTLFWDVQVPANSKQALQYGLTLSAPQNMKVQPGK